LLAQVNADAIHVVQHDVKVAIGNGISLLKGYHPNFQSANLVVIVCNGCVKAFGAGVDQATWSKHGAGPLVQSGGVTRFRREQVSHIAEIVRYGTIKRAIANVSSEGI
jgi:hypothetical protein